MVVLVDTKYYGAILHNAQKNQKIKTRDAAKYFAFQKDSCAVTGTDWTPYRNISYCVCLIMDFICCDAGAIISYNKTGRPRARTNHLHQARVQPWRSLGVVTASLCDDGRRRITINTSFAKYACFYPNWSAYGHCPVQHTPMGHRPKTPAIRLQRESRHPAPATTTRHRSSRYPNPQYRRKVPVGSIPTRAAPYQQFLKPFAQVPMQFVIL